MPKWEYCVLESMSSVQDHQDTGKQKNEIYLLTEDGPKLVLNRQGVPKGQWGLAIGKLLARLGDEGWELVGCGSTGQAYHSLYFKRPK